MKNLKDLLLDFEGLNPFPLFFENGYTPESIKQEIINDFKKYFENESNLATHAMNGLSTIWLAYLSIGNDKHLIKKLNGTVALMKKALKTDQTASIEAYKSWSYAIYETVNKFWTVKSLQINTTDLCIEDVAATTFNMLGQLIEGLMKPYLKFIYHLSKICEKITIDKNTIDNYDLGKIVNELSDLSDHILIQPLNVSLSQWRNIAYHHNYLVDKGKIKCSYGKIKVKEFTLSSIKLIDITKSIYSFFKVLKIAEALFVFDNLEEIQKVDVGNGKEFKFRDESYLMDFYSGLSSQGFLVIDLVIDDEKSVMTLQDLLDEDPIKRGVHSSQFLYNLWLFAKTNTVVIEYKKNDGTTYLISKILGKYLVPLNKGKIDITETIKHVQFDFLGDSQLRDNFDELKKLKEDFNKTDPFKKHFITAIPSEQKFFSQKGSLLTVKEFIKDFTLAVFSNYLVFRELGFKNNQIKINVGSDGSMVVTEGEHNFLLHVPAIIKEKFIQQLIIVCLHDVVALYEKKRLINSIISESKTLHDFYGKHSLFEAQLKQLIS